jgi:hypothetical protein
VEGESGETGRYRVHAETFPAQSGAATQRNIAAFRLL